MPAIRAIRPQSTVPKFRVCTISNFSERYRQLLNQVGMVELVKLLDDDLAGLDSSAEDHANIHRRAWLILQIAECVWDSSNTVCLIDGRGFRGIRLNALKEIEKLLEQKVTLVIYPSLPENAAFSVAGYYSCGQISDGATSMTAEDVEEL